MRGYTSEFIYSYTEQFFIQGNIDSLDAVSAFFDRFDFSKRNYKVYMQLSDSMEPYFDTLKTRIALSFEDDGNFSLIQQRKKRVICYLEIEALDYYKAVAYAYERINIFIKYYQFISNKRNHLLHKFCAVWDCEYERIYHLPITPTGFKAIETHSSVMSPELIDETIMGMQIHGKSGMSTFNKAISLHNSALQQQLPKDGFVNLWSILEVFCPQGEASSKIEPILYSVLPVLQKDYFTTVFATIGTDLLENLTESDYLDLMQQLNSTGSVSEVAAFCLLPEYEQLRDDVFAKLENQPLLRNKIYSLYVLRNNKKELFALTKRYKQRVKWHLYRLYRARNTIVHTGSVPGRIQVLGEHLHSYVDCVMFEVAFRLGANNALQSINNLFVDTILLMNSKEEHFGNGGTVESADIDILFKQNFCPEFSDD